MRAILAVAFLVGTTLLCGCTALQDLTADCGDRKEVRIGPDPWIGGHSTVPGANATIYVWSLDSPTLACTDQHATYTASVRVPPAEEPCRDVQKVELDANVGFTGRTRTLERTSEGYYSIQGDIGVRQASEPQWLFLYLNVHVPEVAPNTPPPTDPESRAPPAQAVTTEDCARRLVGSVDLFLSYLEPKEEG